jgi:hypothetical protein
MSRIHKSTFAYRLRFLLLRPLGLISMDVHSEMQKLKDIHSPTYTSAVIQYDCGGRCVHTFKLKGERLN